MTSAATVRRAEHTARRTGRPALLVLLAMGLVIIAGFAWGTFALLRSSTVGGTGVPIDIPGGQVTVRSVEHVDSAGFGGAVSGTAHAVEVLLTVSTASDEALRVSAQDFTIRGTGVNRPLTAILATPPAQTVLAGHSEDLRLDFAVPDDSTDLVLVLPGGRTVSAEHADHPGDRNR